MPKAQPQQGINDLYTWCLNNGEWGQQLLQEWTGFDENNQFGMIIAKKIFKNLLFLIAKGNNIWYNIDRERWFSHAKSIFWRHEKFNI